MLIGILSDTHGHADAMQSAVALLKSRGAQFFFHCGDIGSEAVLDQLAGEPALAVWGNNDAPHRLGAYAIRIGVRVREEFADVELAGKKFAVTHGDDFALVKRILAKQEHDYLLLGHSHVKSDHRDKRTRVINPGALYRTPQKTVALLETDEDRLEFVIVK